MSLLDECARECMLMEKVRKPDGEGGWIVQWTDGAKFKNYMALDTSMAARRAEQDGMTSLYTVLVERSFQLEYGDFFRDTTTGDTFRVTSNPEEKQAPKSASFALKACTAERKELPQ